MITRTPKTHPKTIKAISTTSMPSRFMRKHPRRLALVFLTPKEKKNHPRNFSPSAWAIGAKGNDLHPAIPTKKIRKEKKSDREREIYRKKNPKGAESSFTKKILPKVGKKSLPKDLFQKIPPKILAWKLLGRRARQNWHHTFFLGA